MISVLLSIPASCTAFIILSTIASTINTKSPYALVPLFPMNSLAGKIGVCGAGNARYKKKGDAEEVCD